MIVCGNRPPYIVFVFLFSFFLSGCAGKEPENKNGFESQKSDDPFVLVLGTIQDGGSPHAGCNKSCCRDLYRKPDVDRKIVSLGLVDPGSGKTWLFEASPDFPEQLFELNAVAGRNKVDPPDGIFITHAHIGHYTGLMYLGRESMNSSGTVVYAMPRFRRFLRDNAPWSQLVTLKNIVLDSLETERQVYLSPSISVMPFLVPHRDEFSETIGFFIQGPAKKILFIPDIDKWNRWNKRIEEVIKQVDLAFIDGTFYDGEEINNRDISEIPHPFISESMELFKSLSQAEKKKIHFIHFNHTNALLMKESKERNALERAGYRIAFKGQKIYL